MRNSDTGIILIAVVAAFAFSCGEPLIPGETNSWTRLATLDHSYSYCPSETVAIDGEDVYFTASVGGDTVIKRYRKGIIEDAYRLKGLEAYSVRIKKLSILEGQGWGAGFRSFYIYKGHGQYSSYNIPLLVRYERGVWAEVDLRGIPRRGFFLDVEPAGPDSCWLLYDTTYDDYNSPSKPRYLYRFEDGVLREMRGVKTFAVKYDPQTRVTYYLGIKNGEIQVTLSPDDGASWFTETAAAGLPSEPFAAAEATACARGGVLYLVADSEVRHELDAIEIIKRTGPPGYGAYELRAHCPEGPCCVNAVAAAADARGRALVVGDQTSIYFDGAKWIQEYQPTIGFAAVAAATDEFYAIGRDGSTCSIVLFHHP